MARQNFSLLCPPEMGKDKPYQTFMKRISGQREWVVKLAPQAGIEG